MSAVRVTGTSRGRTVTTVTLADVGDETDTFLIDVAIVAARETRPSLFGWHVTRYPDDNGAIAHLYTD